MIEATASNHFPWSGKISHRAQLGGIETSVIDNGVGRGTRIAWINTGTGLRFKVVLDRAMDIADTFFNQHSLCWLSHSGITSPEPFSDNGLDWLRTFGGGLLTTCGLDHVGGPETDEHGKRGIHGQISNIPAAIESVVQPDPFSGNMEMSITGRMIQTKVFGPTLELRRQISATLGLPLIRIHDEVTNLANTPAPIMMLYHLNFGWPLIDEGTDILWNGNWQSKNGATDKIFREGSDFRKCPHPLDDHRGAREEVAFIDVIADSSGVCIAGLHNSRLNLATFMRFQKKQLPWLTNWQHWGPGEYVTGLEPGTHPPIGQAKARKENTLIWLPPGQSLRFDLELEVLSDETKIQAITNNILSNNK
jgi:hypothetical protein